MPPAPKLIAYTDGYKQLAIHALVAGIVIICNFAFGEKINAGSKIRQAVYF